MDMVYVLNKDGKPLMATTRGGRVRYLLKENICHAGGQVLPSLVERRLCEAQLYVIGSYSTAPTDYTYSVIGDTVTVRRRR